MKLVGLRRAIKIRLMHGLRRVARRRGYDLSPALSVARVDVLTAAIWGVQSVLERELLIVQVGANDGYTNDPLNSVLGHSRTIRALLIEPHPEAFAELSLRYGSDPRVTLANVAIGPTNGHVDLFVVDQSLVERYEEAGQLRASAVSSFSRAHVASEIAKRLQMHEREAKLHVEVQRVEQVKFMDLLEQSGFLQADVVQIDAEGFDAEIIMAFDFAVHRPAIINYEVKHLSTASHAQLAAHLAGVGYVRIRSGANECALRVPPI